MPTKLESIDTTASFLWNMPGLDRAQFYSAAYYLSLKQRQQKGSQAAHGSYLSSVTKELTQDDDDATVRNVFLDRLALLFARFKRKSMTPANVTATGLVIDGNKWVVYLSKNGGPSEGDEAFAETLQAWFNAKPADEPEEGPGEDGIWNAMTDFWEERITHYAKEILEDLDTDTSGQHAEMQVLSYAKVSEVFEGLDRNVKTDALKRDWDQMTDLSTNLRQWAHDSHLCVKKKKRNNTKRRITFPFEAFQAFYNFWRRDSRQDYPRVEKMTKRFDKRIHNLEMLGLLLSTWKACYRMRKNLGGSSIKFEFIQGLPNFKLLKSELASTIVRWQGSSRFTHDKPLDGLHEARADGTKETSSGSNEEQARELPAFTQYFHCELQMLQLFHQLKDKKPHWYIGCSKLSCHFCSRILENGRKHGQIYETRGSHSKISPNCAFPFSVSDGMGYISDALLTVQYEMLRTINRYAAAIKDEFTEYSAKKDTDQGRTEKKSGTMSLRSKTLKERLSNWAGLHTELPVQNPSKTKSIKALKLSSDGSESFAYVRIERGVTRLPDLPDYLSYEWFERLVGTRRKLFYMFIPSGRTLPVNDWVLKRCQGAARSWSTAVKHCRFRGDLYLVLRCQDEEDDGTDEMGWTLDDVDQMDELDETFLNYENSVRGNYASDVSLWKRTWHGLEEQLIHFFRSELLKDIRFAEELERSERESELLEELSEAQKRYDPDPIDFHHFDPRRRHF